MASGAFPTRHILISELLLAHRAWHRTKAERGQRQIVFKTVESVGARRACPCMCKCDDELCKSLIPKHKIYTHILHPACGHHGTPRQSPASRNNPPFLYNSRNSHLSPLPHKYIREIHHPATYVLPGNHVLCRARPWNHNCGARFAPRVDPLTWTRGICGCFGPS